MSGAAAAQVPAGFDAPHQEYIEGRINFAFGSGRIEELIRQAIDARSAQARIDTERMISRALTSQALRRP